MHPSHLRRDGEAIGKESCCWTGKGGNGANNTEWCHGSQSLAITV